MNGQWIKRIFLCCILLTLAVFLFGEDNFLTHQVYASAMVQNPEQSAEELTQWAQRTGGYYVLRSDDRVVLRIPDAKISELKPYLEENSVEMYE